MFVRSLLLLFDIFKIMVIPNIFLLNNQEHHVIMVNCLCNMCKHLRLVEFEERNVSSDKTPIPYPLSIVLSLFVYRIGMLLF